MTETIKFLIVGDNAAHSQRWRFALEREGVSVDTAYSVEQVIAIMRTNRPDIVLCDSIERARDLKANRNFPDRKNHTGPALYLASGLSGHEELFQALDAGIEGTLEAPDDGQTLHARLRDMKANHILRTGRNSRMETAQICGGNCRYPLVSSKAQLAGMLVSVFESALRKSSELKEAGEKIREMRNEGNTARKALLELLGSCEDAIIIHDISGKVVYANTAAEEIFGRKGGSLLNGPVPFDLTKSRFHEFEVEDREGQGRMLRERSIATSMNGESLTLTAFHDVTETARLRKELELMSLTDDLTGLHNSRGFLLLSERIARLARREGNPVFMLYCDIDNLKAINASLGHPEGDKAITAVAGLLRRSFREADVIARVENDEFAVYGMINDSCVPRSLMDRLEKSIEEYNGNSSNLFSVSVSIGTAKEDEPKAGSVEILLQRARNSMRAMKTRNREAMEKSSPEP